MNAQAYILDQLSKIRQTAPLEGANLAESIEHRILSKKFRKYAVDPEYLAHIREAIALNMERGEPIKFTLMFGGYKLWRLAEFPEADWAELFSIIYFANWLAPIAASYKPGVWFDFYVFDAMIEPMNGIPKADTDAYVASFCGLLNFVEEYLPENFTITLNRVSDQYDSTEALEKDYQEQFAKIKITELTPAQIASIELNVKNPNTSDPLWREKVLHVHDAYLQVSKCRPYYRIPEKIAVCTLRVPNSVAVGTTKCSAAKFWVGVGALRRTEDGLREVVLSPHQVEDFDASWETIAIPGLTGKNFKQIRVANNPL